MLHILHQSTGHFIVLESHLVHDFARREFSEVALRIDKRLGCFADDLEKLAFVFFNFQLMVFNLLL